MATQEACSLPSLGKGVAIFGWLARIAALALAVFAVAATGQDQASASPHRIVAVGDLHGDYEAYIAIMRSAGLVDARGRWAGGATTFVQTGDIPDRGPDSLRIMRHLMRLQPAAERAGGRVIVLVGNHEAMNVTGDLRYVHPGEYAAFVDASSSRRREELYRANRVRIEDSYRRRYPALSDQAIREAWLATVPLGWAEHRRAWAPDGELGRWVRRNPAVVLIDGTLFVHGGIGARYAALPIDEINRRTAAALAAADDSPEAIINDPMGPLWYRGLVTQGEGELAATDPREEIGIVLNAYRARRMVVGHTPAVGGIEALHDGRVIRIDTGISAAYGGTLSYLEIVRGEPRAHRVERPASPPQSAGPGR